MSIFSNGPRYVNPDDLDILEIVPSLSEQLLAAGYVRGVPEGLTTEACLIDSQACRELWCPERPWTGGMDYQAWHKGKAGYRVVAKCPQCGEEVEI
jgi:hypothetical protein